MTQTAETKNRLQQEFEEFHAANPRIYHYFRQFAFDAIYNGIRRFSAYAIMQRIRWEIEVNTHGSSYKINNNHIAFYARMFMRDYPEHSDFFQLRVLRAA